MLKRTTFCLALAALCVGAQASGTFTDRDRELVRHTLGSTVKLDVGIPPYADGRGAWQVRLTPEGSTWIYEYNKARGLSKSAGLQLAPAQNAEQKVWNEWIEAKIAYDRAVAERKAQDQNFGKTSEADMASAGGLAESINVSEPTPGPMPKGLKSLVGEAPAFAAAVKPLLYKISLPGEPVIALVDQPAMRPSFAYFRFAQGVMSGGTALKNYDPNEIARLRKAAGIDESTWRVMTAVSQLEGGFDAINTYDTGYVSSGFIQFTTGSTGLGSLASVLERMKQNDPDAFERDFKRFGIDVSEEPALVVYDPESDSEMKGKEAVLRVIEDKRLTAAFVRAGRLSDAFRVAQLQMARDRYFAGNDTLKLVLRGKETSVKVCELIRSEAGLATLMDRKVHTGRTEPLQAVAQAVADAAKAETLEHVANYEDQIVTQLRYRRDFSKEAGLTQPLASERLVIDLASRGGKYPRSARKKRK